MHFTDKAPVSVEWQSHKELTQINQLSPPLEGLIVLFKKTVKKIKLGKLTTTKKKIQTGDHTFPKKSTNFITLKVNLVLNISIHMSA